MQKPLKIAHIVRRYSRAEWGGTETVVHHTVEQQRALGHDPQVFCTNALQPPGVSAGDDFRAFPYFYPYFPMPRADKLKLDKKGGSPYSHSLFKAVAQFRPDVIHIHAGGRLACRAVQLAERLKVPSVISLHGGAVVVPKSEIEEMLKPLKGKFPYGGILDRIFRLSFDPLSRVGAIICISRAEEARLKELYPNANVQYLPNGVALVGRCAPTPPRRVEDNAPYHVAAPQNILCVSRIDYQKNQIALVELLAARPELRLTLVGPVTAEWYAEKIKARVAELGVSDRFTLIPGLPPGSVELEAEFAKADAFILPSVHEPFGIVALEAMARGIPLIAADVGGLPDFVHDGVNGLLFSPSKPESLVDTFARLAAMSPESVRDMIAAGCSTAESYAWPNVISRLMEVYADIH